MTEGIESVLGDPGDRPDTPDFWRLSEIVLQMDGGSSDGSRTMSSAIASGAYCHPRSMVYVAGQRVLLVLQQVRLPSSMKKALTVVWVEGFIVGSEFRHRKLRDRVRAVLQTGGATARDEEDPYDYEHVSVTERDAEVSRAWRFLESKGYRVLSAEQARTLTEL